MAETQAETAAWLGYGSDPGAVDRLNADHDPLHERLCRWLGCESYSLRVARGEQLTRREQDLAAYEEDMILCVQRFCAHAGIDLRNVLAFSDGNGGSEPAAFRSGTGRSIR